MQDSFKEEDKKKVIEFLNIIAQKAELTMNTQDIIKYYGLLSFMQQVIIPKIDANILEIVKVEESEESKEE